MHILKWQNRTKIPQHKCYVNNLNNAIKTIATASKTDDIAAQIAVQPAVKFNGGGHINHSLFWQNLAPSSSPDTKPSSAPGLMATIEKTWGSVGNLQKAFNAALLGIQGSGWGWLVKFENEGGRLGIVTTKDQDPIVGKGEVPLLGVDMWEYAYYLQYLNGKAVYVENIWQVMSWKTAEHRYNGEQRDPWKALKQNML